MGWCSRQPLKWNSESTIPPDCVIINGIDVAFTRHERWIAKMNLRRYGSKVKSIRRFRCDRCGWAITQCYLYADNPYSLYFWEKPSDEAIMERVTYHSDRCRRQGHGD